MPEKCKNRERLVAAGSSDIPALPVGAVRGLLCFRCFSPSDKIMKCAGCKRAGYCSKECQKLDWSVVHKKQCKILTGVNKQEEDNYRKARTWNEYSGELQRYVREVKATSTDDNLWFIIQAQPYCAVCRRSAIQLSTRKTLLNRCDECQLIFTCTDCSSKQSHPPSVCSNYQIHSQIEQFRIEFFEDTEKATPVNCTATPRTTYKPLSEATNGWFDYYVDISDKTSIRSAIKPDFSGLTDLVYQLGEKADQEQEERRRMFLLLSTDILTMPLTIISALEDISWITPKPSPSPTRELSIHLIGATGREFHALSTFEEILHLIPDIKTLHITAAGPLSWRGEPDEALQLPYMPPTELACCPACTSSNRKRYIASWRGLYHDFVSTSVYRKPDLLVLFNSGCVDGDDAESSWAPTIRGIVESDVPALFTTYNAEEAEHERYMFGRLDAKFLVEPAVNRWRGLVPVPEFLDEEFGVWRQNYYRYVICGKER